LYDTTKIKISVVILGEKHVVKFKFAKDIS